MPREVHEHFDAEGNLTGTTVVTRESEWDDDTRDRVMALAAYEDAMCRCGCGLPMEEAHQPNAFVVDKFTCYAGRAVTQARRQDQERGTREKKPEGWLDGVHYFVKPYSKEDRRAN